MKIVYASIKVPGIDVPVLLVSYETGYICVEYTGTCTAIVSKHGLQIKSPKQDWCDIDVEATKAITDYGVKLIENFEQVLALITPLTPQALTTVGKEKIAIDYRIELDGILTLAAEDAGHPYELNIDMGDPLTISPRSDVARLKLDGLALALFCAFGQVAMEAEQYYKECHEYNQAIGRQLVALLGAEVWAVVNEGQPKRTAHRRKK